MLETHSPRHACQPQWCVIHDLHLKDVRYCFVAQVTTDWSKLELQTLFHAAQAALFPQEGQPLDDEPESVLEAARLRGKMFAREAALIVAAMSR